MTLAFIVVTWVISLCCHEFSHAIVAYRGGDTSVKSKGYLTFNPLKYTHPVYSLLYPMIILLIGGIGLPGGAVYIDRSRLRSNGWESAVSLAGPAANAVCALLLSLPFLLGNLSSGTGWFPPCLAFAVVLQVSSVILNLIPVPPLDGFGAISPWLPPSLRRLASDGSGIGMMAVFIVISFVRPVNVAFWKLVYGLCAMLGVSSDLASEGYRAFKIW